MLDSKPDLQSKVAVVTGGNTGVGYETAFALLKYGATVYLTVRSEAKGKAAIDRMASTNPAGKNYVHLLIMDLEDVKSVQDAARSLLEKEQRLDIVVNNAAELATPYSETKEGISKHMAVNHIGHFVFVTTLLPLLEKTAQLQGTDVRIVTLASDAHKSVTGSNVTFDSVESFNIQSSSSFRISRYLHVYGLSKLANMLMTRELQRRMDEKAIPIICLSVHPGFVDTTQSEGKTRTPFGSDVAWFPSRFAYLFATSVEKGARTSVFAATDPAVRKNPGMYKGNYLVPYGRVEKGSSLSNDMKLAGTLWETTEKILKEKYGV